MRIVAAPIAEDQAPKCELAHTSVCLSKKQRLTGCAVRWPLAIYGFVQNKAQALLDVNFYNVCDDQEGKIMFERLITAIIMVVAVAIVASGLPLSSISGAGSGALGFFNLSPIF